LLIAANNRLDAEQVLRGVFVHVSDEESSLVQLGRAALEMEWYPLAEEALLGALQLNPGRTAIRLTLVEALLANGKLQEAEAQVQELPQSGQTASLVHKLLGDIHLQRKHFRLAVEEYRATVLHLPDNAQLLAELNQELAATGVEAADWEDLAETLQPSLADRVAGETERMSQNRKQRRERR
jgi:thioredoxin-like negative regulator of GroEL